MKIPLTKEVRKPEDIEDIWFAWYPILTKDNYGRGTITRLVWLQKVIRHIYYVGDSNIGIDKCTHYNYID
jgi:hypothetical protein